MLDVPPLHADTASMLNWMHLSVYRLIRSESIHAGDPIEPRILPAGGWSHSSAPRLTIIRALPGSPLMLTCISLLRTGQAWKPACSVFGVSRPARTTAIPLLYPGGGPLFDTSVRVLAVATGGTEATGRAAGRVGGGESWVVGDRVGRTAEVTGGYHLAGSRVGNPARRHRHASVAKWSIARRRQDATTVAWSTGGPVRLSPGALTVCRVAGPNPAGGIGRA